MTKATGRGRNLEKWDGMDGWDKVYFLDIGPTETLACTMLPYETEGAHVHFGTLLADTVEGVGETCSVHMNTVSSCSAHEWGQRRVKWKWKQPAEGTKGGR